MTYCIILEIIASLIISNSVKCSVTTFFLTHSDITFSVIKCFSFFFTTCECKKIYEKIMLLYICLSRLPRTKDYFTPESTLMLCTRKVTYTGWVEKKSYVWSEFSLSFVAERNVVGILNKAIYFAYFTCRIKFSLFC